MNFAIAQLRHLYQQMLDGRVKDTKEAATGLLGPAIVELEKYSDKLEKTENYLSRFIDHTYVCQASDGENCDCPDIEINQVRNELSKTKTIVDRLIYNAVRQCRYCLRVQGEEHGTYCGIDKILKGS